MWRVRCFLTFLTNVVELAIQLGKWLEAVRHGHMRDFVYDSIDHDEPLLNFSVHENGVQLYSNWQEFEVKELVTLFNVNKCCHKIYSCVKW